MSKIDDLKQEATDLGISFSPNIGEAKLQDKIDAHYEKEESGSIEKMVEKAEASKKEETPKKEVKKGGFDRRTLAKEREAAARKTKVITIIDNDQRVNNQTTTATVNCGNMYFDLGTMVLPLQMEVEVQQGHIDVLKSVMIPQHMKKAGANGLSEVVMRPRYTISYSDKSPE
jgi:hypothetical protein